MAGVALAQEDARSFRAAKAAKTRSATTPSSRIGRSRSRSLPGHDGWTYGAAQSVFAESPDRVFVLQRGELPVVERPATQRLRDVAPSLEYPVFRLPIRSATVASPPAGGAAGTMPPDGLKAWQEQGGVLGVDARWEHCILVFDRDGNVIEDWTQWDSLLARPHAVYVSPYDPDKHVWIVDDFRHAIFKFTNDGKRLVQTIGTVGEPGADATHFFRPTFMAWLPDGSFFVADGYENTRVVKFDATGQYLMAWGERGTPPNDTRPGYLNNVHGIAVDRAHAPRVRQRPRQQSRAGVRRERPLPRPMDVRRPAVGHPCVSRSTAPGTSGPPIAARTRSSSTRSTAPLLYSWGTWGTFAGGFWGVHGMSVDAEGNFYTAEVDTGRVQKFRPLPDANPQLPGGAAAHRGTRRLTVSQLTAASRSAIPSSIMVNRVAFPTHASRKMGAAGKGLQPLDE